MTDDEAGDAPALCDDATRRSFGFDGADDTWLDRCRQALVQPAPARLGDYELILEAGRGTQGSVYKAVQPATGRVVAIKRLGAGRLATPTMRARFDREVRVLASLSHPGVVTVFDAEEIDGQRVLLMEWIDGAPIDQWAGAQPVRQRLLALALVCDAVHHAHQRGVIHRDLKPSNILVDAAARPHVLDFGLAKLLEDEATEAVGPAMSRTTFVGTPAYAAPEQMRGTDSVDTRTDVYALGVILYELLTGSAPIQRRAGLAEMLDAVCRDEPRRPSSLVRALGVELDAIVLKALAKEPERRYQSVEALGADVRRFLAGEPVLAHPPGRGYRARKFLRRHRAGVAAAGVVCLALVAGGAAAVGQALRATRAEAGAEIERDAAKTQARRAEASRAFLSQMLQFARPERGGLDPTVREMLDWATRRVESGALRDEPEVEADVCESLKRSYFALGLYSAALSPAEVVMRQRVASLGETHRASLSAMRDVVQIYCECSRAEEAHALMARCVDLARASYGEDDEQTLEYLMQMGNLLMRLQRAEEAEPIHLKVLAQRRLKHGDDDWRTALAGWELGAVYRNQGRHAEAVPLYEKALEVMRREHGEGSLAAIRIGYSLASHVYMPLGRFADAESLLRQTLERGTPALGAHHTEIISARSVLASLLRTRGDLEGSATIYHELVDDTRAHKPQPDSATVAYQLCYAHVLLDLGRPAEALPLAREALAARVTLSGEMKVPTLRAHVLLGEALLENGDMTEARRELLIGLRGFEQAFPRDGYRWVSTCALAVILAAEGRMDEAQALAESGYREMAQLVPAWHPELVTARRRLNLIRQALGQPLEPTPVPTTEDASKQLDRDDGASEQ